MKKLLILTLVAILAISMCFITACDPPVPPEGNTSSSDSSSDESSSSSKINISRPSYEDTSDSSNYEQSSSSYVTPGSGSNFSVSNVPVDDVTTPVGMAISAINMIGTITADNYIQKGQYIENAFEKCDKVSDKSQIPNYESLLAAKAAYQAFKLEGDYLLFIANFESLPDEINEENFLIFYQVIEAYNELNEEQLARVDNSIKDRIVELKAEVDALPKPAPAFTTTYAIRTETAYGLNVTWDFSKSPEEFKTLGSYLANGKNDSGLSFHASGEDTRIKKSDHLSMKPGSRIFIPVGQKFSGNILMITAGESNGRYFVLETGGNYSDVTKISFGTLSSNIEKRIWSKPKSKETDADRGPNNFYFTPQDLTYVGAPFYDYCLVLVAQGGEMKASSFILTRG